MFVSNRAPRDPLWNELGDMKRGKLLLQITKFLSDLTNVIKTSMFPHVDGNRVLSCPPLGSTLGIKRKLLIYEDGMGSGNSVKIE